MKDFKFYFAYVAVAALVMTSCSKEDNPDRPEDPNGENMVAISFNAMLEDFNSSRAHFSLNKQANPQNQGEDALPECSEADPASIRVAIENSDEQWVSGNEYIDIPVIPNGEGGWMTEESEDLELPEDEYSLEYFAVLDGNNNIIYIAPRNDDDYGPAEYQNFVENPLPISIDLREGVKKYVDVEVLCYDPHFVYSYGYLFFDFEEVDIVYLCLFGNICDEIGRHSPAEFQFEVWELSDDITNPKGDLLYSDVNETGTYDNGDEYANPLCVALPDYGMGDETVYYGELSIFNDNTEEWEVIRMGAFSQDDVESLELGSEYIPEGYDSASNYFHFREGNCSNQDDSEPCLFSPVTEINNNFDDGFIAGVDDTDYHEYPGDSPYGSYLITDNPSDLYSGFDSDINDSGNMLVLDGSPDAKDRAYYTLDTPELCAGATYYVTMRLRDLSDPDTNNARLNIGYKTEDNSLSNHLTEFTINELESEDLETDWKHVGFVLEADGDGQMIIDVRDIETANSGNDFAMDDITFSNDPAVLLGIASDNINPAN